MDKEGNGVRIKTDLPASNGTCLAHEQLVSQLANLCTSLKWMVKLGFFLMPFILAFAAYITIQTQQIRVDLALQGQKLETVCQQLADHLKQSHQNEAK